MFSSRQSEFESALRALPGAEPLFLPLALHGVCAGFPSPADDHLDGEIDLLEMLVPNRPATFLWRVDGHSMRDAGIYHDDILIVDRSLKPSHGDVVVAIVNGERSLKRLLLEKGRARLVMESAEFPAYELHDGAEVEIWGVVRANVHWHRGRR